MGHLLATAICSLDLRTADAGGDFSWARPTREVHAFVNEAERAVGTVLYGRGMWETMRFWLTAPDDDSVEGEYGRIWRAADKVVYSASLAAVDAPRTRLERRFDPAAVRADVRSSPTDVSVGGSALAGSAMRAGLVDELRLLVAPVVVGSGPRAIPDGLEAPLDLLDSHTLGGGWTFLRYGFRH